MNSNDNKMAQVRSAEMAELDDNSNGNTPTRKERMRVARACDICKRKKTKCDGNRPCESCTRYNRLCVYSTSNSNQTSGGVKGVASPIPPPTATTNTESLGNNTQDDVVKQLMDRIAYLENKLEHTNADLKNQRLDSEEMETFNEKEPANLEKIIHPEQIVAAQPRIRFTSRYYQVLAHVFGKYLKRSLAPQNQRLGAVPRPQTYGYNLSGSHYLQSRKIHAPEQDLLSRPTEEYLLNYYFDHINPLYAILHKQMFMKQYATAMDKQDQPECRLFIAIFHAVCAIAMRWSEVVEGKQWASGLEEKLFDDAHEVIQAFAFEWESIEIVQGQLLLTMYLRATHRQASCWAMLGQALRLAHGLGVMKKTLHQNRKKYDRLKFTRIFWCCYTWDRLVGIDFGRSFYLKDEEVTWDSMTRYVDDGWLTPMAYGLIKLAQCISSLDSSKGHPLRHVISKVHDSLDEWNADMELQFGLGKNNELTTTANQLRQLGYQCDENMITQFRLQYLECYFFNYRLTMLGLALSPSYEISISTTDCRVICECCQSIIRILEDLLYNVHSGKIKTMWWLSMSTLHNATMCLLLIVNTGFSNHASLTPEIQRAMRLADIFAADERFTMAKELQWSLKALNHLVCMRLEEAQTELTAAGIDHGDGAFVNRHHFAPLGAFDADGKLKPLNQKQNSIVENTATSNIFPQQPIAAVDFSSMLGENGANLGSSIEWFDNWTFDSDIFDTK